MASLLWSGNYYLPVELETVCPPHLPAMTNYSQTASNYSSPAIDVIGSARYMMLMLLTRRCQSALPPGVTSYTSTGPDDPTIPGLNPYPTSVFPLKSLRAELTTGAKFFGVADSPRPYVLCPLTLHTRLPWNSLRSRGDRRTSRCDREISPVQYAVR